MIKIKKYKNTKPVPFIKMVPNFITIIGLVVGVSSIRFALDSKWEPAVYCILVAGLIDGIDGRVARILNATSPFGAELDSLCDFANFGIAPALLIYLWSFQQYEFKVLSWAAISLYIACMAIRLARFNISPGLKTFFTGVPAPAGALLALTPIILDFEISTAFGINVRSHTVLIDLYMVVVGLMLPSHIPTFSFKNINIKPEYLAPLMIFFSLIMICMIIYPWYLLPLLVVIYICSIPLSFIWAHKTQKQVN